MSQPTSSDNWQNIIWREWRYAEDEEYARYLFELVADEPVGWVAVVVIVFFSLVYGIPAGWLIGSLFMPITMTNFVRPAFIVIGSASGGIVGYIAVMFIRRHLSWKVWLIWLTHNMSFQNLIGSLILAPVVGLLFGLLGTLVGLIIAGLFGLGSILGLVSMVGGMAIGLGVGLEILVLYRGTGKDSVSINMMQKYRWLWFWWRKRPYMSELETALQAAYQNQDSAQKLWTTPLRELERTRKQPGLPDGLVLALQSTHWNERFVARHALIAIGGESVEPLLVVIKDQTFPFELHPITTWLLQNIEWETKNELAEQSSTLLCYRCLVRCHPHKVELSQLSSITYYGCRACSQSREFITWPGEVVAVLDAEWSEDRTEQNASLRVNWLTRRNLFDFDRIEIIQATDEEVERFAVQVGNDTDTFRKPRYKQMRCTVVPNCQLSENTRRILRSLFGEVANTLCAASGQKSPEEVGEQG